MRETNTTGTAVLPAARFMPAYADTTRSSEPPAGSPRRRLTIFAQIATVLMLLAGATLVAASPAQAVSYRDIKSVRYGRCVYAVGDALEDIYLYSCTAKPAKFGNWQTTLVGYYNGHPLWTLKRQGSSNDCLGVLGDASSNYLYMYCQAAYARNVWEVFKTSSGHYVLKSFGAFRSWNQHKCLTFPGPGAVRLGRCDLVSTVDQIYR
ncbi:hypothetical protein ACFY36_51115 [Actinoplanes sp. NPDC000266]